MSKNSFYRKGKECYPYKLAQQHLASTLGKIVIMNWWDNPNSIQNPKLYV
jgi:hypothetical protein